MTEKHPKDQITPALSVDEVKDKIRSQLGPTANAFLLEIEKGMASGVIQGNELDQLIAALEQLSDTSQAH
ncbi:hypothetical protein S7S_12765 [Isoalcanivorax pacificus W11-5]|uniref:Uncharacterized protein n=1 Tax=Isoalcanivorax pacificus W11-5 TaxID=391936 RepID=A0A0B4XQD2_9GAMM|nr:hypothetical protein [Isoalcanivorax pacificus]AJD48965.1 hypothetical protein S7S_12765 [Isoalcanivorax pacificus W11-5]